MRNAIMLVAIVFMASMVLGSCASSPKSDKIVGSSSRSYKAQKAPKWTRVPTDIKGGMVLVVGQIDVGGEQSPSICYTGSDLKAKGNLISEINSRLQRQMQYASEGADIRSQTIRDIINQSSQVDLVTGLKIKDRFYEKVYVRNGPMRDVRYTCYSQAELPLSTFKELVEEALAKHAGGNSTPYKTFRQRVEESWDKFFNSEEGE